MKKVLLIILCAVIAVSCLPFSVNAKAVTVKVPKLKSVTQTNLKQAKISWTRSSAAKGYVLYYSTNGKKYKKLATTTQKSYIHKKLTNNKKYYYKVKAYKKVSGKTKYSKFSNIKVVTISSYLDYIKIIKAKRYTENEGDSFVDVIGKNPSRGNGNTDIYGNKYKHGIEGWIARWNGYAEKSWAYSVFNINEKFTKLKGKCVLIKSYNTYNFDTTLDFCDGDEVIKSYQLTPETIPFSIDVDVKGVKELKIYFHDNDYFEGGTSFGLVNMKLS